MCKNSETTRLSELPVGEHGQVQEGGAGRGCGSSAHPTLSLALHTSSIWLFIYSLNTKTILLSRAAFQSSVNLLSTLSNLRENYGYPKFLVRWTAAEVVWGLYLQRVSELGQSPQPLGPTLAPGSYIRNELCCWTPSWC